MATTINLVRVVAWLTDPRPQKRRAAPLGGVGVCCIGVRHQESLLGLGHIRGGSSRIDYAAIWGLSPA